MNSWDKIINFEVAVMKGIDLRTFGNVSNELGVE